MTEKMKKSCDSCKHDDDDYLCGRKLRLGWDKCWQPKEETWEDRLSVLATWKLLQCYLDENYCIELKQFIRSEIKRAVLEYDKELFTGHTILEDSFFQQRENCLKKLGE